MHEQLKALKTELEQNLQCQITPDLEVCVWLVRYSAWLLVRFHPWKGGATPYCRVHGSGCGGKIVRFGEKVMVLDPCETSKPQNRWLEGIWLGKAEESDEHDVAVNNEIGRYRSLRRHADHDSRAWDAQAVL